jgi:hypothetical protein
MRKLVWAALLASACGGPPYRVSEKAPDKVATIDSTAMVALDDEAKWGFELVDSRSQTLADGRLKAQVRILNKTPKEMHVQLCWTFKDDQMFSVEQDTPFEHMIIAAGRTLDVSRQSLTTNATHFAVQVKTAKAGEF